VLMLGPVCVALALVMAHRRRSDAVTAAATGGGTAPVVARLSLRQLVPWFIVGFMVMMAARSLGLIPAAVLPALGQITTALTVIAMAALGLSTDARAVARSGPRIAAVVTLSLLALIGLALAVIWLLDLL